MRQKIGVRRQSVPIPFDTIMAKELMRPAQHFFVGIAGEILLNAIQTPKGRIGSQELKLHVHEHFVIDPRIQVQTFRRVGKIAKADDQMLLDSWVIFPCNIEIVLKLSQKKQSGLRLGGLFVKILLISKPISQLDQLVAERKGGGFLVLKNIPAIGIEILAGKERILMKLNDALSPALIVSGACAQKFIYDDTIEKRLGCAGVLRPDFVDLSKRRRLFAIQARQRRMR